MRVRVVEDRVLAQIAYRAAASGAASATPEAADVAYGHAVIALRVSGISVGPELLRALRADVDGIVSDPERLARARLAAGAPAPRAVNANKRFPVPRSAAAG